MKTINKLLISSLLIIFGFFPNIIGKEQSDVKPQSGGILRAIRGTFPTVVGYAPEMGPSDDIFAIPYVEKLTNWNNKGEQVPELAESWDIDLKKKTLTWHIRKGVKFHDGTPLNAEAVKWNYQLLLDNGRMPDGEYITSFEVVDQYTLRLHLSEYNSMSLTNYGWVIIFSPAAFFRNGGKDWSRMHAVGTGPFKLANFKRDVSIKYERNPEYWRKGYPLLDGIEIFYITDYNTAAMMMIKKEADAWLDISDVRHILDMEEKGFKINWGPGMFWALLPNSKDPKSPFSNKLVREAVEYAIDRPAIAKMLGYGRFEPLQQMSPSGSPSFIPDYNPRPYDPGKAKKLLDEAGYPDGFKIKILSMEIGKDAATMVQTYLSTVGIRTTVDVADIGRYFGALFKSGWNDLVISASGINPDASDLFVHFGPRPMTYRTDNIYKSPEFLSLCNTALHTYKPSAAKKALQAAVRQGSEDAMIIPLFRSAQANAMQKYVHSEYMTIHGITWNIYEDWLEK